MKFFGGHLLIASPDLLDPNFARSVVLLTQHNEEGAFGIILNRPSKLTIGNIWNEISDTPCENAEPLYCGGPCPGPLLAIHTDQSLSESEVLSGLYLSAQKESLERLLGQQEALIKFFAGYAGWGGGQLESELKSGSWLTKRATLEHVFYDQTDLWEKVVKLAGGSTLLSALNIKHVPDDPSLN